MLFRSNALEQDPTQLDQIQQALGLADQQTPMEPQPSGVTDPSSVSDTGVSDPSLAEPPPTEPGPPDQDFDDLSQ